MTMAAALLVQGPAAAPSARIPNYVIPAKADSCITVVPAKGDLCTIVIPAQAGIHGGEGDGFPVSTGTTGAGAPP